MGHTVQALVPVNCLGTCSEWGVDAQATYPDMEEVIRSAIYFGEGDVHAVSQAWIERHSGVVVEPSLALAKFQPDLVVWNSDADCASLYEHAKQVPTVVAHCGTVQDAAVSSHISREPHRPALMASSPVFSRSQVIEVAQAGRREFRGLYLRTGPARFDHVNKGGAFFSFAASSMTWSIGSPGKNQGKGSYSAKGSGVLPPKDGWRACGACAGDPGPPVVVNYIGMETAAPSSLPLHVHQTGAWLLDGDDCLAGEVSEDLRAFLEAGPAPLAVGWGCALGVYRVGVSPRRMLILVLRALRLSGRRAVVVGCWARLQDLVSEGLAGGGDERERGAADLEALEEFARRSCFFAADVPYSRLLPRCSCAVHHGGAGTVHACLHAGRPSVITPLAFDQPQWADAVNRLGVGVGIMKPAWEITPQELASAIALAEMMTPTAEELGRTLREERGVAQAAEVLTEFLQREGRSWGTANSGVSKANQFCTLNQSHCSVL